MASSEMTCELEEGEISDDAEELGDYDARTAREPRPPAKPFGIVVESSQHTHKPRHRAKNSAPPPSRYYKKPLVTFNGPNGSHYDRNGQGHPWSASNGVVRPSLRSAVMFRGPPPSPVRGGSSLQSYVVRDSRTSAADDRNNRRTTSHLDHYSWFRRSSSGGGGSTRDSEKLSSHGRFPPPLPSSQRSRPERSSSPKTPHSSSTRKNQSQPKFLQNSVSNEPSYEDLLAQYRSIQNQLEDLNKHSFEEHKSTPSSSHEKSSSRKNDAKKKSHKPKCRKARKQSQSEDKPRQACAEEVKEQVPPPLEASPIPVICSVNVESHPSPLILEEISASPPPVLPETSDAAGEDNDDDDDDLDLVELRRRALESIKTTKAPPVVQEEKPAEDAESASVLPFEVLPSDLLEADRPIQEVQEKQQLKKGQKHPWYDRELTQQMRRKDRAYHKWKRHPCYDNWEAFKALKREYTRMLKRKRTAYAQETSQAEALEAAAATPAVDGAEVAVPESTAVPAAVVSDGVESSCDSVLLPLDSIPLPNPQSEDNYEPVEMEVDSDDGTQPPTLEVAGTSEDEDEEALRAQLLQAVLQKRRKPRTSSESQQQQQQLHQHQQQSAQQQQQQRANHRTPLSPLDNASALGGQLLEATGARLPKAAQPGAFTTPKTRHQVPKGAEAPFIDTRKLTEPLVINLGEDDTTSEEEDEEEDEEEPEPAMENSFSLGLDRLLKEARQKSQVPAVPIAVAAPAPLGSTPVSVMKLSQAQQLEYRRLKAEIARRELRSIVGATSEAQQQQILRARRLKQQASAKRSLEALENTLHTERKALSLEGKRMNTLRAEVLTKKSAVRGTQVRIQRLREQLATLERLVAGHATGIRKANVQLQTLQTAVDKRKGHIAELENQCRIHGKILYGAKYQLPETADALASGSSPGAPKRKISISSLQQVQKRPRITGPDSTDGAATAQTRRTDAAFLAEKIRLQKLEAEMRLRLQELKQGSLSVPSAPTPPPLQSSATIAPETVATAPTSPSAGSASTATKAVSRKVVVSTGGKDVAAVAAKAVDVGSGTVTSAPTVTVTITVGNDVQATEEPPSEQPPPTEASEEPTLGSHHRAAMEAMFLDHCTKQLRARCSEVALLPSSEFVLPQKDEMTRLELCLLRHRRDDGVALRGPPQRCVDVSVPYVSPLLHLRGYRLHPNFLKQEGQSLDSTSYSHRMHSRIHLCRYELGGSCYDARCNRQHEKDYKCTPDEVLMDLALYSPTLLKISPSDSPQQWKQKAEIYVANMKRKHQGLDTEALCRLIVTDVNRSLNKAAPYYTAVQRRGWFPQQSQNSSRVLKALEALEKPAPLTTEKDWQSLLQQQRVDTDDPELIDLDPEVRYFDSAHLGTAALEALVSEQPHNVGLWLRLAYRHLHGRKKDGDDDEEEEKEEEKEGGRRDDPEARLDQALNVFSQALENNRSSPEVWRHYLGWYAAHPQCQDLDYLCRKALDYCSHNAVWWKCAVLVDSLSSKCQLCQQQLYNLTQGVSGGKQPDSRCILEVILYWARICATAGNMPLAFLILKTSCKSAIEFEYFVDAREAEELLDTTTRDILQCANMLLSPDDLCFLWLCYLHFAEFRTLPTGLFCVERGSVGRLCSTDCFEIPWGDRQTLTQSLDTLVCAFHEGMDELGGPEKCVPLFASHLHLLASHAEVVDAVLLCNTALEENPSWSDGWLQLVALHLKSGDFEEACNALQRGLSQLPTDARLVFKAASGKFGMSDIVLRQLLDNFVVHHFHVDEDNPLRGERDGARDSVVSFPKLVNENDSHATYARLNFIELVKLSGASSSDVSELYETLVTAATTTFDVQLAWWWYLNYRLDGAIRRESGAAAALSALVERCLESTPSRRPLPTEPRKTWDDHGFANHVLDLLAAHMTSPRDAADLLRSYLGGDRAKPNSALVQRVVELYLEADDRDTAETVLRAALVPGLQSQRLWQLGIQLAVTDGDSYEVHRLFEAAVLSMPYHADLWCHFLIYELTQGHEEHARKVVESASKYQVPGTQEILDSFLAKELTEEEALNRLGVFLLPP
ncbi:uncharacterized protein LOC144142775 isoform X3 [Haemaphysalis longicornis]